jgi:hypothetical protein
LHVMILHQLLLSFTLAVRQNEVSRVRLDDSRATSLSRE